MTLLSVVAGLLSAGLTAGPTHLPQASAASSHGSFHWVRGSVTAVSACSVTLQLRNKPLTLTLDSATQVFAPGGAAASIARALPAVGSVVEAHYAERDHVRRAALIYEQAGGGSTELSKRPGKSYRGVANGVQRSRLTVRIDTKSRRITLDRKTRLTDNGGHALAVGRGPIGALLTTGEEVLISYTEQDDSMIVGDVTIPGSSERALEIRRMRP